MPAKIKKSTRFLILINCISFLILIVNLNFNVRTFRLTQDLQALTINLQDLERALEEKEYHYYTNTSLDKIYDKAVNDLGMFRQSNTVVFTNSEIELR